MASSATVTEIPDRLRLVPEEDLPADLPETIEGTGGDGHRYVYRVIGMYADGMLRTSSWDAMHVDEGCPCENPEEWY